MIHAQNAKLMVLKAPGTIATNATATAAFSRAEHEHVSIFAIFPAATATNSSAKFAALSFLEATASNGSFTAIPGLTGTTNTTATTAQFLISQHNDTSNAASWRFDIPSDGRQKWYSVAATPIAGYTDFTIIALLSQSNEAPAENGGATVTQVFPYTA